MYEADTLRCPASTEGVEDSRRVSAFRVGKLRIGVLLSKNGSRSSSSSTREKVHA